MNDFKFNSGDRVRILDGSNIDDYTGSFSKPMTRMIGEETTVESMFVKDNKATYRLIGHSGYMFDERGLERVADTDVIADVPSDSTPPDVNHGVVSFGPSSIYEIGVDIGNKIAVCKSLGITSEFVSKYIETSASSVREVKRIAEPNEYVKITNAASPKATDYKNGDILRIIRPTLFLGPDAYAHYKDNYGKFLYASEYVVLENYDPPVEKQKTYDTEYYNGKFVVLNNVDSSLRAGQLYDVINGRFDIDSGKYPTTDPIIDFADLQDYLKGIKYTSLVRKRHFTSETIEIAEIKE